MGKNDKIKDTEKIVDGVLISSGGQEVKEEEEVVEIIEDTGWSIEDEYKEDMLKSKKPRTVSEYMIDMRSFGVPLNVITCDQILNRIKSLKITTQKRKITALRSYAKWAASRGEVGLYVELMKLEKMK